MRLPPNNYKEDVCQELLGPPRRKILPEKMPKAKKFGGKEGKKDARGKQTDLKPDPGRTELLSLTKSAE